MIEYNFKHRTLGSNLVIESETFCIALGMLGTLTTDVKYWELITKE